MNKPIVKIVLAMSLAIAATGCGVTAGGLKDDPGYAAFKYPAFWEADKEVSLSLGPTIMGFARIFIDDDEEFSQLIKDVKGLHLRVYNIDDNIDVIGDYIATSTEQLNLRGWETLVTVREEDEQVAVLVKMDLEKIQGMVVLVAEPREAVFINVIGNIKPEALQPLIAAVYGDAPDAVSTL